MEFAETDELIEKLDIDIREYMEHHRLPQWFVDKVAEKYLNVSYIRKRTRELYPIIFSGIAPFMETVDQ